MSLEIVGAITLNPIKSRMNLPLSMTQSLFKNKIETVIIDGLNEISRDMKQNILCKATLPDFKHLNLFGLKDSLGNCAFIITTKNTSKIHIIHLLNTMNRDISLLDKSNFLEYYSDSKNIDPFIKVNIQLEETRDLLVKTIGGVLDRGEKLETLVMKTEDLSKQANMFYKRSKKLNSCCSWW
jgi:hypothetical protein